MPPMRSTVTALPNLSRVPGRKPMSPRFQTLRTLAAHSPSTTSGCEYQNLAKLSTTGSVRGTSCLRARRKASRKRSSLRGRRSDASLACAAASSSRSADSDAARSASSSRTAPVTGSTSVRGARGARCMKENIPNAWTVGKGCSGGSGDTERGLRGRTPKRKTKSEPTATCSRRTRYSTKHQRTPQPNRCRIRTVVGTNQ